jgi:hypothetical protein
VAVGCDWAGGWVGGGGSVLTVDAIAVRVDVIPGSGVGMTMMVSVGVGAGWVGNLVASLEGVLCDSAAWSCRASLLDLKLVRATYIPNMITRRTIRKPKA